MARGTCPPPVHHRFPQTLIFNQRQTIQRAVNFPSGAGSWCPAGRWQCQHGFALGTCGKGGGNKREHREKDGLWQLGKAPPLVSHANTPAPGCEERSCQEQMRASLEDAAAMATGPACCHTDRGHNSRVRVPRGSQPDSEGLRVNNSCIPFIPGLHCLRNELSRFSWRAFPRRLGARNATPS